MKQLGAYATLPNRMISIIVAMDKNRVIGRENKIPWRLRSDLVRLKKLTLGHPVILGRKTYESMEWYYNRSGRQMPGSIYIVVSRNTSYKPASANTRVVHSVPDALSLAQSLGDDSIFVIGGGGIFEEVLPVTDRIYLTRVDAEAEGDALFPIIDMQDWQEASIEHHPKSDQDDHDYDLVVLERP